MESHMTMMKIVVCETNDEADLAEERMRQRNFQILQAAQVFHDVIWDGSMAKPSDAPLAFGDHFVVIGFRP